MKRFFKVYFSLLVMALAMLLVVGCGKKDVVSTVQLHFYDGDNIESIEVDISGVSDDLKIVDLLNDERFAEEIQATFENGILKSIHNLQLQNEDEYFRYFIDSEYTQESVETMEIDSKKYYEFFITDFEHNLKDRDELLFMISDKENDPTYYLPELADVVYSQEQTLADINLPAGWAWVDQDVIPTVAQHKYAAIFTPEDTTKYKVVHADISLNILKATPEVTIPSDQEIVYTEALVLQDIELDEGWQWLEPNEQLEAGSKKHIAVFYPSDNENYQEVNAEILVTVLKKKIESTPPTIDTVYYTEGLLVSDIELSDGWKFVDENQAIELGKNSYPVYLDCGDNYEILYSEVEIEALVDERPFIYTTLHEDRTYGQETISFDIWARTTEDKKIAVDDLVVKLNGEDLESKRDNDVKSTYEISLASGKNDIYIEAVDGDNVSVYEFSIYYTEGPRKVTISIDTFTIGCGYIVEPIELVLDEATLADMIDVLKLSTTVEELNSNLRGSHVLIYVLEKYGFGHQYTGTLTSSFYLSLVTGFEHSFNAPDSFAELLASMGFVVDKDWSDDVLGEFDYTFGSGWMYAVNGFFPNVGFADYYVQDGDVIRTQFTLCYGSDIGGSSSMGWGYADDFFEFVFRDDLTYLLGYINANDISIDSEILDEAFAVMATLGITQQELDHIYNILLDEIGQ